MLSQNVTMQRSKINSRILVPIFIETKWNIPFILYVKKGIICYFLYKILSQPDRYECVVVRWYFVCFISLNLDSDAGCGNFSLLVLLTKL